MSDLSEIRYIKNQKINIALPTKGNGKKLRKLRRFLYTNLNLGTIFERLNDNFTDAALLYQDILSFSFDRSQKDDKNRSFKYSELAYWLIKKNKELINFYSGSKAHISKRRRLHNHEERFKNKLSDLISMNLISIKRKVRASKIDHQVEDYEITREGEFLALLIKDIDVKYEIASPANYDYARSISEDNELSLSDKKLFEVLNSLLSKNDSYFIIFYRNYLKKIYDKKIFYKLKNYLYKLCYENKGIQNVNDLLQSIIVYDLLPQDRNDRKIFYNIWKETLEELDIESKQIILHNLKVYLESCFRKYSNINRSYEKSHFDNREDYENIVLSANCEKCHWSNIKSYSITDYKYEISYNSDEKDDIRFDCTHCNSSKSCIIPRFQPSYQLNNF